MTQKRESIFTLIFKTYVRAVKFCIKIYLWLYLWWFLINFISLLFGHFRFLSLFTSLPYAITHLIPFTFINYAISMSVVSLIIRFIFARVERGKNGELTRPYPFAFWYFKMFFLGIGVLLPIRAFSKYNLALEKTRVVLTIIIVLMILSFLLSIHVTKKGMKQTFREKRLCAYLSLSEWNDQFDTNVAVGSDFGNFRFSQPYFHIGDYVHKTDNGIICPYWLYINYFNKSNFGKIKMVIFTDTKSISNLDNYQIQNIFTIIDECIMRNEPVMVIYKKKSFDVTGSKLYTGSLSKQNEFLQELLKRPVQFVCGEEIKEGTIKDFIMKEEENVSYTELVLKFRRYLEQFEDKDKYRFIKEEITKIDNSIDEVATFYRLVKMAEYIFHYRAIALLSKGKGQIELISRERFESSMGTWKDIQNISRKVFKDDKLLDAYRVIDSIMNKSAGNKKVVKYSEICDLLVQLRNRYIGHGTMAFAVSPRLLSALMQLVLVLLEEFLEDGLEISETDVLKPEILEGKELSCILKEVDHIGGVPYVGLLCGFMQDKELHMEYLDYNKGQIRSNSKLTYDLSYHIN